MKIVFLVKRFYTNKDLIEDRFGRLFYFPATLATLGHDCTVVALDFRSSERSIVSKDGVRFLSVPVRSLWRPGRVRWLAREIGSLDADVVFSSGDSYVGYLGLRLAKRRKRKAVFDIYDDYARFGTNRVPFMPALLKSAVRNSDLLLCASQAICDKYGPLGRRALVAQNAVDDRIFRPEEQSVARTKVGIDPGLVVVGYFGSIHEPRGAHELLAAVTQLREQRGDVRLLMAGQTVGDVRLSEPWIDYRGMVDQTDIVPMINSCDVVTIPYRNTELMKMTNACKLMEYIACGVPVVVSDVADYASYFPASFGCVSEPGDADSLAEAIGRQLDNRNIAKPESVLTWRTVVSAIDRELRQLV